MASASQTAVRLIVMMIAVEIGWEYLIHDLSIDDLTINTSKSTLINRPFDSRRVELDF